MNYLHVVFAVAASCIIASLTDWYFFGILFHDRYGNSPGVWKKYKTKKEETRSIVLAQGMMSLSSLVFVLFCARLGWSEFSTTIGAALLIWLMIPVPLLVSNAIFIPMDRLIVVSHSLGWLIRLLLTAICVSILL